MIWETLLTPKIKSIDEIVASTIPPWYKRIWYILKYGFDWPHLYAYGYTNKELDTYYKVSIIKNAEDRENRLNNFRKNF